ncbi:MAG: biotin/lipoyl-binding protein, partial [Sphaerospermopsis kisseleviana]
MENIHGESKSQHSKPLMTMLMLALVVTSVSASWYFFSNQTNTQKAISVEANTPAIKAVTALGRIEPQGEVVQVSVSSVTGSNRVGQLLVKEGDRIKKGQVIAILDNHDRRLALLNQAKQQVKVAESHLAQVKAGAKQGEIEAQQATISELVALLRQESAARTARVKRLEAEVKNAQIEYQRYQSLLLEGAISTSNR